MFKTKRIVVLSALILLIAFVCAACAPKKAITKEDFVSKSKALGYEIEEEQPDEEYDYVVSGTMAAKKDTDVDQWFVLFVVSTTEEDAEGIFNYNKDEAANGVSTGVSETRTNHSATYQSNKDGMYYYYSYVDTTLLIVEVESAYKDEAKTLIKELGY